MTYTLEIGPFNAADTPDASMTWVDITAYVNDNLMPLSFSGGRQTELQAATPGEFSVVLNNPDHRFTPGSPTSPYGTGFATGMRVRYRETIGYRSFTLFDGNMLQPETVVNTLGVDQTVTLAATDRLGRLQNGRKFISTLAEYIMANGGGSLKAYYPLNETRAPFRDVVGGQPNFVPQYATSSLGATNPGAATITPGGGTNPPGDDARGVLAAPASTPSGTINAFTSYYQLYANYSRSANPIAVTAGTAVTIVAWVTLDSSWNDRQYIFSGFLGNATIPTIFFRRNDFLNATTNSGQWDCGVIDFSGFNLEASGLRDPAGRSGSTIVGMQFSYNSPNAISLWVDNQQYPAITSTGTLSASGSFLGNTFLGPWAGTISHFQIYVGPYTFAQFKAQRDAGLTGLAGQYTGQRITTIAGYAGIPSGELMVDPGTVRMPNTSLAGQDPLTAINNAVTTEQGRLRVQGRKLIFEDKTRGYNR